MEGGCQGSGNLTRLSMLKLSDEIDNAEGFRLQPCATATSVSTVMPPENGDGKFPVRFVTVNYTSGFRFPEVSLHE